MADLRKKRIAEFIEPLRVTPGRRVTLSKDFDPGYKAGIPHKEQGVELVAHGVELLSEYQERLAAQDTHGVIVVLQALDAAGKDGTIRHVMSGVNPQGVSVHSSRRRRRSSSTTTTCGASPPTCLAAARSASSTVPTTKRSSSCACTPRSSRTSSCRGRRAGGTSGRSATATSTTGSATSPTRGSRIVKLLLNLSKEEQRVRFLRRIDLPDHNWKFSAADVKERSYWDDYQKAFSEMLSNTSTEWAPWYVIPADHKWFARACASAIIANALIKIDPRFPKVTPEALRPCRRRSCSWRPKLPTAPRPTRSRLQEADKAGKSERKRARRRAARRPRTRSDPTAASARGRRWHRLTRQRPRRRGRPSAGTRSRPTRSPRRFGVDPASGLSAAKAAELLQKDGPNKLPVEKGEPGWRRFLDQYRAYMQIILLIAAVDLAGHRPVEHGSGADRAHRVQRRDRPAPGGQGRERDERAQVADETVGARAPRRRRGRDPGRGGRRRRRRHARGGRRRRRRREDHRGALAGHRRVGADRRERAGVQDDGPARGRRPRARRPDQRGVHEHTGDAR